MTMAVQKMVWPQRDYLSLFDSQIEEIVIGTVLRYPQALDLACDLERRRALSIG